MFTNLKKNGTEVKSEIPVIKVEEINSVLKIGEEMVILGGMMKEVVENRDAGLPGMADTPLKGYLEIRKIIEMFQN